MRKRQSGFAFLLVLLMATLVLIALSIAVPRILTQGQREKEEELIFRGNQYRRAIGLYYRRYGRFPMKISDLLRSNDRSYLRRAFPDPMNPKGEWRLIRVGPSGELIGSVTKPLSLGISTGGGSSRDTQPRGGASDAREGEDSPYPIIGVASQSTAASIRVYQSRTQYDEWEFIFDPTGAIGTGRGQGGTNPPTQPTQRR